MILYKAATVVSVPVINLSTPTSAPGNMQYQSGVPPQYGPSVWSSMGQPYLPYSPYHLQQQQQQQQQQQFQQYLQLQQGGMPTS